MSRILAMDIGAGTQDILIFDTDTQEHFKIVMESPTRIIGKMIAGLDEDLFVFGETMGGGPVTKSLKKQIRKRKIYITPRAAATIHNDLKKVEDQGFILVDGDQNAFPELENLFKVELGDLDKTRLENLLDAMSIPREFDFLLLALQDHGFSPCGVSNLDFRNHFFAQRIEENPVPEHFLYSSNELPKFFTRMHASLRLARALPAKEIFIMDSGMAAILGASQDESTRGIDTFLVLDIATSHTLGAIIDKGEIAGFFEYHTRDITQKKIEELIVRLAEGDISHQKILEEGGHGAYLRKAPGFSSIKAFIATGPKRSLLKNSSFDIRFGSPLGDNMMTGTIGLVEALFQRKGWKK